ncbi:AbiU2 domain-containing protein [Vibrio campbellii]
MKDEEVLEIFNKLKNEVTDMHYRWSLYREVFAGGAEQVELLNLSGSNFFYYVQHMMLDQMALSFSKLTDPNQTRVRKQLIENLSLKQMHAYASKTNNTELLELIVPVYDELSNNCEKFRLLRNKRIAHGDLEHAMHLAEKPLPGISRAYVETALEILRRYLNIIELHYFDSETAYDALIAPEGSGGTRLIEVLRLANNA